MPQASTINATTVATPHPKGEKRLGATMPNAAVPTTQAKSAKEARSAIGCGRVLGQAEYSNTAANNSNKTPTIWSTAGALNSIQLATSTGKTSIEKPVRAEKTQLVASAARKTLVRIGKTPRSVQHNAFTVTLPLHACQGRGPFNCTPATSNRETVLISEQVS